MATNPAKPTRLQRSGGHDRGLGIGALFGIEIRLDASLIIIFTLMVYLLGNNVFPAWHPDWQLATSWLTALAAGILFFASVLAHELAHALVSRHFGIEVRRITLFLFGGLAEMEEEPREPRAEFLVAIAGPLTSLALGLLFLLAANSLAGADFGRLIVEDQEAALASLSPVASTMMWLGPVNIVLAVFNMVPGFPLDGGRVFRATLWWLTGDLRRATRIATESGRWCGWFLMILGITQALSGLLLQGLWLLMIGWFLTNAASTSYRQVVIKDLLKGISARDLMRTHFETVTAQLRVADFIDSYLLQSSQLLWPVIEDDRLIGLVTLDQVKDTPPESRVAMTVGQVMRTDLDALTLPADTDASRALTELGSHNSPLAVVAGNRVVGLLSQLDVIRWLQLHPQTR
jgi:Zn-dependent protease/predicted transcriptional regulator